jgi:hypothetical protein
LRDVYRKKKRRGKKIKREEVGWAKQWVTHGIGLGHIEEMAVEFEERTDCSGKINGPIKIEDFTSNSK